ncbi:MAG: CRISPR-associated protein Cas4 [Rhodoblastus sp.]|nr:MAG: CRISPR-associated protein Cas4 [Rhodoblastus sp.]
MQHGVYCLRQAALIHVEQLWEENRFTAEGRVMHERADMPGERAGRGVRRLSALALASTAFGVAGVADLVEMRAGPEGERPYPVEFKRGKPKPHRADEAQLCAQALCLEEMFGVAVPEGALFYGETKRRVVVAMDDDLRRLTRATVAALREIFMAGVTPPPTVERRRCRACSLLDQCRPDAAGRDVAGWRRRRVAAALGGQAASEGPP